MRWWTCLTFAIVACSGDNGGDDGGGTDGGGTDGGGGSDVVIDCSTLPTYNLDELDCESTWTAFLAIAQAASACNNDHDCQVAQPDCINWTQSTCFVAANDCLTLDIVSEYNTAGKDCHTATQDGCYMTCGPVPDVECTDHVCVFVYE